MGSPAAKTTARRVRFGDVVRLCTDRSPDPAADGIERYVGLEHLEPGDLRVRKWGLVAEGTTFTNRFKPGQVLFGKRRAYQGKVAVADFEGVCSGDIYVLESANASLQPGLLPFICQTDAFFQHAVGTSAGSLSPRTNWKSLADFEFVLPPLDEQVAWLDKCQAAEGLLAAQGDLREALQNSLDAILEHLATARGTRLDANGRVADEDLPRAWKRYSIRELCAGGDCGLTLGPFGSDLTVKDYGHLKKGTPVLFVADVQRFELRHQSAKFISREKHAALRAHEALPGDVLVTEMGWPPGEACVVPQEWPPSIIKADIIRARTNRKLMDPLYLCAVLNSHWGMRQLVRISPGTTRPRMTLRDFERVELAVPTAEEQQDAMKQVIALLELIAQLRNRRAALATIKSHLMREMLMPGAA